jgi:hypothetical protein
MPLEPQEFQQLVAPWPELEPPGGLDEDEVVERLGREADAAAAEGEAGRRAAAGLVIAVGNYELLSHRRAAVFQKANELLDQYGDPELSRRFG